MQDTGTRNLIASLREVLKYRFSLKADQADYSDIDRNIRDGMELKGTPLWVLMFAIFVASIGLNVNSTAVIIGAMLISPLMGPIMGVGYGVGIYDFDLIRKSLKNLALAVLIGLLTSSFYFLVSPLSGAQSELLARTTPTIWDVLIALFGGLAGIIGVTRKEKTNVIPGVAIATALMPPLCTAGYGLATGNMHYFFGAFYLFFINCVFIAFSTIVVIGFINPPHKRFVSAAVEKRVHRYVTAVVLVTVLPSLYLAYSMVKVELFRSEARDFIKNELVFDNTYIAQQDISPAANKIEVTAIGNEITKAQLLDMEKRLQRYGLAGTRLIVRQSENKPVDVASLKASLLNDLLVSGQSTVQEKDKKIQELEKQLVAAKTGEADQQRIARELFAQYPAVTDVVLATAPIWNADGTSRQSALVLELTLNQSISAEDKRKIIAWLKIRTGVDQVKFHSAKSGAGL